MDARSEETGSYRPLPAGRILTDQIQKVQDEMRVNWSRTRDPRGFPELSNLWISAKSTALTRLDKDADDRAASLLLSEWAQADTFHTSPDSRGWALPWGEAHERFEAIQIYMVRSGLLEPTNAEPDSPRHYLTKKELAISEQ